MRALWDQGPSTVHGVVGGIFGEPQLAYTTVQTTLNVLEKKGRVKRKLVGRAYEYSPLITQEAAGTHAVGEILHRVFRGSVEDLLMSLVRGKHLSRKKLAKVEALLANPDSKKEEQ